jgi:hypothetical protein
MKMKATGGYIGRLETLNALFEAMEKEIKKPMPNLRERTAQLESDLNDAISKLIGDYTRDTQLQVRSIEVRMVDATNIGSVRREYVFVGVSVEVVV